MPIYEYRCDACDTVFEEWHKHADDVMEQSCPKCHELAHRQISNTTFMLKGGGWYVTEYGNRKSDSAPSAPSSTDSGTDSGKAAPETTTAPPPATSPAPAPAAAD